MSNKELNKLVVEQAIDDASSKRHIDDPDEFAKYVFHNMSGLSSFNLKQLDDVIENYFKEKEIKD